MKTQKEILGEIEDNFNNAVRLSEELGANSTELGGNDIGKMVVDIDNHGTKILSLAKQLTIIKRKESK